MRHPPRPPGAALTILLRGACVSWVGQAFGAAVAVAHVIVLGRLFGREGLGLYSTGFPLARYLTVAALLGIDAAVVRELAALRAEGRREAIGGVIAWAGGLSLAAGLVAGGVMLLGAGPIASRLLAEPRVAELLRLFALTVPVWAVLTVVCSALQAHDRQDLRVVPAQVVLPAAQLALVVALGLAGYAVASAVTARLLALVLAALIAICLAWRLGALSSGPAIAPARRTRMLRFGLPACGAGLLIAGTNSLALLLCTALAGAAQTGLFAAALRISFAGMLVLRSVTWAFDPLVARLLAEDRREDLGRLLRTVVKLLVALNLPLALALGAAAEPIAALFGPGFAEAVPAMRVMAADLAIASLVYLLVHVLMFAGRSRRALANNAALLALIAALDVLLIPRMGAVGAAWAQLAAEALMVMALVAQVRRALRIRAVDGALLRLAGVAGLTLGPATGLAGAPVATSWLAASGVAAVCYAPLAWRVAFNARERRRLAEAASRGGPGEEV